MTVSEHETTTEHAAEPTRRDFLYMVTGMAGVVGAASVAWPFIDQMRPDASTLALASIEVDVSALEPGMSLTVKWRGKPVFIHRFPSAIKAFYMKPDPENPEVALGSDLIAPDGYGEIIGGGQRIDDYDLLLQRIQEHDLPQEAFDWYLDLRRYGSVPHGGFGLGIERVVAWICGTQHVRESSPFPRTIYRITP